MVKCGSVCWYWHIYVRNIQWHFMQPNPWNSEKWLKHTIELKKCKKTKMHIECVWNQDYVIAEIMKCTLCEPNKFAQIKWRKMHETMISISRRILSHFFYWGENSSHFTNVTLEKFTAFSSSSTSIACNDFIVFVFICAFSLSRKWWESTPVQLTQSIRVELMNRWPINWFCQPICRL